MKNKATELTKKEKSALLQGTDFMYTHGVPRLGIPPLAMADGPHGLRKQIGGGITESPKASLQPHSRRRHAWHPRGIPKMPKKSGGQSARNVAITGCICFSAPD